MTKSFFLLVFSVAILFSCDIRNKNSKKSLSQDFKEHTKVEVFEASFDFGNVKEGIDVTHEYRFKNIGNKPLIITGAMGSCGCTVPEKPDHPIAPGEIGIIKATFHTESRPGPASKSITVVSNAEPDFPILKLSGTVIGSEE